MIGASLSNQSPRSFLSETRQKRHCGRELPNAAVLQVHKRLATIGLDSRPAFQASEPRFPAKSTHFSAVGKSSGGRLMHHLQRRLCTAAFLFAWKSCFLPLFAVHPYLCFFLFVGSWCWRWNVNFVLRPKVMATFGFTASFLFFGQKCVLVFHLHIT